MKLKIYFYLIVLYIKLFDTYVDTLKIDTIYYIHL